MHLWPCVQLALHDPDPELGSHELALLNLELGALGVIQLASAAVLLSYSLCHSISILAPCCTTGMLKLRSAHSSLCPVPSSRALPVPPGHNNAQREFLGSLAGFDSLYLWVAEPTLWWWTVVCRKCRFRLCISTFLSASVHYLGQKWQENILPYNLEGKRSLKRGLYRSTQYVRTPMVPPALTVPGHTPGAPPHCPPYVSPPRPSAPAPEMPQQHQPAVAYNSVHPVPIPRAVTDASAPLLPLCQPSGYPGSSSSAPLPEAVGHDARKNYWVKNWECQTQAVKKNEGINKKLSIWLLGLYYISFHLHRITPSPCETGRDWVSVTQGSSHLSNCQSILSCNMPTCNFADEMIFFFAVSPFLLY